MDDQNVEPMEEVYDEAELSGDDFEQLSFDDLLDRVESNSPSLTNLRFRLRIFVQNNDDHRHRLERLSTAIGRNTQLKALMFDGWGINEALAMDVLRGIVCNQSIKRLHFRHCGASFAGNACRILTPLFKNNQVERLIFNSCNMSIEGIDLLATSLTEFDSLKEFDSADVAMIHHDSQQAARELIQSLSGHPRLRKLDVSHTNVGQLGCSALVDLLRNPSSKLRVLNLDSNHLDDSDAVALSSGIAGNVSLKEINLGFNRGITQAGWRAIFDTLRTSSCRLEKLVLEYNTINDDAAQCFSDALASNITLKTLNLGCIRDITLTGWRVFFDSLNISSCALENLDLPSNNYDFTDEVMTSLTDALASKMALESLNLNDNDGVTGAGWQRFFSTVLANPISELEKLDLGSCGNINDAAMRSITNALVNNSKLKVLYLTNNNQITNAGWEMFSSVLESPNTALEELDLDGNEMSDATCTALLHFLANNKKLKKLIFEHSDDWEPPLSVLCNADSIVSTYNSNHILQKVGFEDDYPLHEEFESLLQINREHSPSQAARLKIMMTHFNKGFITQPFVGMDLNVLPHAMAWMGRDGRPGDVNDHFYGLIGSIASLFENAD